MQDKLRLLTYFVMVVLLMILTGCGQTDSPDAQTGTLQFTANGEAFIREGFVSKDGWDLEFSHAYLTLSDFTAYQSDPAYDVDDGWDIKSTVSVILPGTFLVDLADPAADPAILGQLEDALAGHYNALSWTMVQAETGPAAGYMLVLEGIATRDGEKVEFIIRFTEELVVQGGEYIGDDRKGIVSVGGSAEVEATFHFDHLFGDGEEDPDDDLNKEALGFDPFAALAVNGHLDITSTALDSSDYQALQNILLNLAHVGEGHCLARFK